MSDEIENQETNVPEQQQEEKQYSPVELKAIEQGWRPKEEFDGEPERFIDAAEFIRRGELFQKIDSQNRELKQVKLALEGLKEHHAKVEKSAYDRAIADLKRQRKEALAEGDVDLYDKLDERVEELKEERDEFVQQASRAPQQPAIAPEFTNWVERNKWYETDPIMRGAADTYGVMLARQGKGPEEVLKLVEAEIRKEFAHKFKNPNRERTSAVETPATRGGDRKSKYQPTDAERQIAKTFVRTGIFKTEAEYYAELEKMEKGN